MTLSPVTAALALCALLLPVSIAGSNIALGLLALALALRWGRDWQRVRAAWSREPALAVLLLYAGAGLLAAAFSDAPAESVRDGIKDLHRVWALGLFVAALALEPNAPLRPALGLSFAAMALYGLAQTAFGTGPNGMMVRAHGFVHPVVYGQQMALAALGGACALLRPAPNASRAPVAALTALVLAALVFNQTRMALLAAFAGLACVALLEPRARRWALAALLLVAAIGAAWEFMPNGGRALSSSFAQYDPRNPHQARWALWNTALRMFQAHPAVGVGPGGYRRLFTLFHPGPLDNEFAWGSAHNLYLHQLAERGVCGALALLALCATLFSRAARAARESFDARALWAVAAVAFLLAMSLTETSFQNEQFSTLLLLIWAWGTVSLR